MFLFLGIKFSKIDKSDVGVNLNNYEWFEVARVIDGDTIEVKINSNTESVRLIGIDSPEIEGKTKQEGIESKKYLKKLIGTEKLRLEGDESQDDRDVDNRLLRYVFLKDGIMVKVR